MSRQARQTHPLPPGRMEFFSDGVLAVAITLLVLDLRVPAPGGPESLGRELLALWPNLLAYVVSFVAIGIMWINHHTLVRRLEGVDHSVLVLNLLLLLCIVLLPFTTSLLATYLDAARGGHLAAAVYAGSLLAISSVFLGLERHLLLRRRHLLRHPLSPTEVRILLRRAAVAPPAYLLAGAAGLASPYLTLGVCAALGGYYLFASPSARRIDVRPGAPGGGAGAARR